MEGLILILLFFILLGIGVPVAYSIGISSLVVIWFSLDAWIAFNTLSQRIATGLDSFSLLAIPFFILAGQLMNKGGIARRLINFAKALVGLFPGGLIYVNIIACMLFGAISGSAVAAASAIGSFMLPRMKKEGYPEPLSAAVNISSATTGLVIPPSNVLIVFSLASGGASIAALFLAGYIPGLLIGLGLILTSALMVRKHKLPRAASISFTQVFRSFVDALPSLMLLFIVMGGIVGGIFTATEASAIAVIYSLVLVIIYKEVNWDDFMAVGLSSVKTTSIVLFLVANSMAMSWVMSYQDIPQAVTDLMLSISDNKIVLLILINLILLVVGVFMDITPAILIFTPIFLPVAQKMGMDVVHFGIMMVINLCIGLCTPPVGSVLFVGCSVANLSIRQVIRPLLPLFVSMILILLLVTYVPEVSLFLPRLLGF
ncbi:MAG: TRAP transporter large permease subunit [Cyclobacteriaceae bacterium]|nr:TRAP transporter large permease subunit [Cyclobacteriaceae bacterium]